MKQLLHSIFKITTISTQIVANSFIKALKEEIILSQNLAKARAANRISAPKSTMSLDEAKLILNVTNLDQNEIYNKWKYLFEANQKSGSFYLLSKVVRAKERLDSELLSENIKK